MFNRNRRATSWDVFIVSRRYRYSPIDTYAYVHPSYVWSEHIWFGLYLLMINLQKAALPDGLHA